MGVAVEGSAPGQMILGSDGRNAFPIEERSLDFAALWMAANAAFAGVIRRLLRAARRGGPAARRGWGLLRHFVDISYCRDSSYFHGHFSRAAEKRIVADGVPFDKASSKRSEVTEESATGPEYKFGTSPVDLYLGI